MRRAGEADRERVEAEHTRRFTRRRNRLVGRLQHMAQQRGFGIGHHRAMLVIG